MSAYHFDTPPESYPLLKTLTTLKTRSVKTRPKTSVPKYAFSVVSAFQRRIDEWVGMETRKTAILNATAHSSRSITSYFRGARVQFHRDKGEGVGERNKQESGDMSPNQRAYQCRRRLQQFAEVQRAAKIAVLEQPPLGPPLTVEQVAGRMGCSKRTIYRYRRDPNYRYYADEFREQWRQRHPVKHLIQQATAQHEQRVRQAFGRDAASRYRQDQPSPLIQRLNSRRPGGAIPIAIPDAYPKYVLDTVQCAAMDKVRKLLPPTPTDGKKWSAKTLREVSNVSWGIMFRTDRANLYGNIVRSLFMNCTWKKIATAVELSERHIQNIRRRDDFQLALSAAIEAALGLRIPWKRLPFRVRNRAGSMYSMRPRPAQLRSGPQPSSRERWERASAEDEGRRVTAAG